jgi:AcrR family transcriptional regulator
MARRPADSPSSDIREIILESAGRIFAQNGFRATTVRMITQEAGVNVAAINYYFQDKQELYARVLQRAHQAAARTADADRAGSPQQRLQAFIHRFLDYLFDPQRPEWQGRLIAREIAEPSPALDRFVAESIAPVKERLFGILRELLGPQASEEQKRRIAFSILGQCLYYVHCREMIKRLFPAEPQEGRDIEALAEHVFHFSLGGITALQRRMKASPSKSRPSTKAQTKFAP